MSVWNPQTLRRIVGPVRVSAGLHSIEFSADGQRLLTISTWNGATAAQVWNAPSAEAMFKPIAAEGRAARFSADGTRLVTCSNEVM